MTDALAFIDTMIAHHGPELTEYPDLYCAYADIMGKVRANPNVAASLSVLYTRYQRIYANSRSLIGHVTLCPRGYHGDFEIIDKIYTRAINATKPYKKWDLFFQSLAATQAVRNRKQLFTDKMHEWYGGQTKPLRILYLNSGPARDVAEFIAQSQLSGPVQIQCVENDLRAIRYAHKTVGIQSETSSVEFRHELSLRFHPQGTYDVIWVPGISDYLSKRLIATMLKRLIPALAPHGHLYWGNFGHENPSRDVMEFSGWRVYQRGPNELRECARNAGCGASKITIETEETAINHFLHIEEGLT